jgi:hypothetical protein
MNFQFVFLGNEQTTCLHAVGSLDIDRMEGRDIYFWCLYNKNSTREKRNVLKFDIYVG